MSASVRKEAKKSDDLRLQVVLSHQGVASRRASGRLIEEGRVSVNGNTVREKGLRIDPAKDRIAIDGRPLNTEEDPQKAYYVFHKPAGVTTTLSDPYAEQTLADFLNSIPQKVYPVGRLDRDTTGLLILTNDGELAFRLSHPSYEVDKVYEAVVSGRVTPDQLRRLEKGIELDEGKTAPCRIQFIGSGGGPGASRSQPESFLRITLHEGKKRQIRRMFQAIARPVLFLQRVAYGPLGLQNLAPGQIRALSDKQVSLLLDSVGLEPETSN